MLRHRFFTFVFFKISHQKRLLFLICCGFTSYIIYIKKMSPMPTPSDTLCKHVIVYLFVIARTSSFQSWPSPSLRTYSHPLYLRGLWSALITRSTSSCLLIRSVLPYGPAGGSRQAGRLGRGKCWIPVGHWLHKLLLMREVLSERAASSNDHNGGSGWQMQPRSKGDLIKHTHTQTHTCAHVGTHAHTHLQGALL